MKNSTEKEISTTVPAGPLTMQEGIGMFFGPEIVRENMQGVLPRLPQIRILHCEAQMFKWPDGSKYEAFIGIILQKQKCNAWWKESFDETGGGTPPDCYSLDSIRPDLNCNDEQSEKCKPCSQNQFGSDGRGKACKNMTRLHIVVESIVSVAPFRLTLPPSNQRVWEDYLSMVSMKGVPVQLVRTQFNLIRAANKDGIKYSQIVLTPLGTIKDRALEETLFKMYQQWLPAMQGQEILAEET